MRYAIFMCLIAQNCFAGEYPLQLIVDHKEVVEKRVMERTEKGYEWILGEQIEVEKDVYTVTGSLRIEELDCSVKLYEYTEVQKYYEGSSIPTSFEREGWFLQRGDKVYKKWTLDKGWVPVKVEQKPKKRGRCSA